MNWIEQVTDKRQHSAGTFRVCKFSLIWNKENAEGCKALHRESIETSIKQTAYEKKGKCIKNIEIFDYMLTRRPLHIKKKYTAMLLAFAMSLSIISGCASSKPSNLPDDSPEIHGSEMINRVDSGDSELDIDKVSDGEEAVLGIDAADEADSAECSIPESGRPTVPVTGDEFGSLNGAAFSAGKNDWDTTFGADGWEFQEDTDGEYYFVIADNPKYKNGQIYAYSQETLDTIQVNSTAESVKTNGFYGYSVRMAYAENKPAMTWGGLTFGASAEDILDVYGEPEFVYEGSLYSSYQFRVKDNAIR